MVWSIDTDNFRGEWNQKKFPLLHSIQDTLNSGETLDPSNPKCSGTAPMCDVEPSTTTTTTTTTIPVTSPTTSSPFDPSQCTEVNDVIPYPGDCHRYLMCLDNGQGGYNLQVNFDQIFYIPGSPHLTWKKHIKQFLTLPGKNRIRCRI